MSNLSNTISAECTIDRSCNAIELIIQSKDMDLGGFFVRRVLPTRERQMVGPWIFFDHMGPAQFSAGSGVNVRPHPHINLATVTYLFEGEILHRDSLGSLQPVRPGDINLMVAGKGIVHSERERQEVTATDHKLHGLQLWLALPEDKEEIEPAFYHYPGSDVPSLNVGGVAVRVIMGTAYGETSPVRVHSDTLYVEALLQKGQSLLLPEAAERALYVVSGAVQAKESIIPEHSMAVFSPQSDIEITATEEARIALIGGEKFAPRYMEWNFISSRKERLEKAKSDWNAGRFPIVPGDEEEFIPFPVR